MGLVIRALFCNHLKISPQSHLMPQSGRTIIFFGALALLVAVIVLLLSTEKAPAPEAQTAPPKQRTTAEIPTVQSAVPSVLDTPAATSRLSEYRSERPVPSPAPGVVAAADVPVDPAAEEQKFALFEALREASAIYSPEGIPLIEPSLYSSDREIREAAANALVVLGEGAGAAVLRQAAAKASDPGEAADLLKKAEYLELPPGRLLRRGNNAAPNQPPSR